MKVLLAVDGSPQSFDAAQAIRHLTFSHPPVLLHVVADPDTEAATKGKELLVRIRELLPTTCGTPHERIEAGIPAEVILSVAKEEQCDLIVIGARGFSPVAEVIFGSVSHPVLIDASCPALVVKRPLPSLQRILLPLEGREDADAVQVFLAKTPFPHNVQVTVVTAVDDDTLSDPDGQAARTSATSFVEGVASNISSLGYAATSSVVVGTPTDAILRLASTMRADLILMGSHGKKALQRIALGSVSHDILHKFQGPTALFRISTGPQTSH